MATNTSGGLLADYSGNMHGICIAVALPTIVKDIPEFPASAFIWVGSAYSLAAAALLPLSGALAESFGRKYVMLAALSLFCLGSLLCGLGHNTAMFLAGRAIQGAGGGGLVGLTNLILADLVSLQERGKYNGLLGVVWVIASVVGPVISGALATAGQWRWLFWLNLPLSAVVALLIIFFLNLKTPGQSLSEKFQRIDHGGNILIIASTTAIVLAATWGGVVYEWSSVHILVPLCLGLSGLVLFGFYEAHIPKEPLTPMFLFKSRTTISGYIQTLLIQAIAVCTTYYLPVYYQACKLATASKAGTDFLGLALSLAPVSIVVGLTIAIYKCYRPQLWIGWSISMIGFGILSIPTAESPLWHYIGFTIVLGTGLGTTYTATVYPILAPLPVTANAPAISLAMFSRLTGQIWGVSIGGSILQNQLRHSLPVEMITLLPPGVQDLAYGSIVVLRKIKDPVILLQARTAYADSLRVLWLVLCGASGFGLLVALLMQDIPMHTYTDEKWDLKEGSKEDASEKTESDSNAA
ncbi:Mfs1.2 [Flagelloscypha sp. PMI_526]|nr:Mfs1.2 [Flagelloscypha sp. PMI_526]